MKQSIGILLIIVIILSLIGLAFWGNSISNKHSIATIEMQDGQKIVVELYDDVAPETVANFIKLANNGFYDGLIFHRVIPGFMIQGGDPEGNGTGSSGTNIKGEFLENEFENYLSHKAGTISMARSDDYNSASSQFFITAQDNGESLDGSYAAFGRVIEGMDVVESIVNMPVVTTEEGAQGQDRPINPPVIKTITIQKNAVEFNEGSQYDKEEVENNTYNRFLQQLQSYGYEIDEDGNLVAPNSSDGTYVEGMEIE